MELGVGSQMRVRRRVKDSAAMGERVFEEDEVMPG